MNARTVRLRLAAVAAALIFAIGLAAVPASSYAFTKHAKTHKNFVQRHATATSIAAGYAAYKIAKTTGKNRAAHGRKLNFAQRHPVMTGIAAGMVTHHYIKKSIKKHHG